MAKIVRKWLKIAENSWKWMEMDGNGQNGQNSKNSQKRLKMAKKDHESCQPPNFNLPKSQRPQISMTPNLNDPKSQQPRISTTANLNDRESR